MSKTEFVMVPRDYVADREALLCKALADVEYIQKECGADVSPGYIGCLVDDLHDLLSASAEPSAPAEIDERGAFELQFPGFKAMVIDAKASQKAGRRIEQQSNMFKAWLARAALEHKT